MSGPVPWGEEDVGILGASLLILADRRRRRRIGLTVAAVVILAGLALGALA